MKKVTAALMISLLSAAALAGGTTESASVHGKVTPVVSVVALSATDAQELASVRNEYQARKIQLDAEYAARLEAILAKATAGES